MRRFFAFAGAAILTCLASAARADEPAGDGEHAAASTATGERGPLLGVRAGVALPVGGALGSPRALLTSAVPIGVFAGWRLSRHFALLASFDYAFANARKIDGGYCEHPSCGAHDLRIGVGATWRFAPDASFDPWVGLSVAYESATITYPAYAPDAAGNGPFGPSPVPGGSVTREGFEPVRLELGADVRLAPHVAVGPYVAASIVGLVDSSRDDRDVGVGGWLSAGARGAFDL